MKGVREGERRVREKVRKKRKREVGRKEKK